MSLQRIHWLVSLGFVLAAGCTIGGGDGGDDTGSGSGSGSGGTVTPPPPPPPKPAPAVYKRGSLSPIYQLTPEQEQFRFTELGATMSDTDFISTANNFTSSASKMDEIAQQIGIERGGTGPINIITNADRNRATQIPFRGNPSDVKLISVNGSREAYVPLGGDLMTPGNEVVALDMNGAQPTRIATIKVGIRPQRIAIHPAGLVFVCNQFSNYITIIDPTTHAVLKNATGQPVEIKTEFYCSDMVFAPHSVAANDPDKQDLYVGNSWRASVLKYELTVVRSALRNQVVDVTVAQGANPTSASAPTAEIGGVGANPFRLNLGQDQKTLFVANSRGGELARVDLQSNSVKRIAFNAPAIDVVQVNDVLIVPTTMVDRGLPAFTDQMPAPINAPKAIMAGLDGQPHEVHPGAQTDGTKAYNFEDMRNGLFSVDANLTNPTPVYFTDDISPEANYVQAQKVVKGSIPQAIVLNKARTKAFVAMSGSDVVQQFSIVNGVFRIAAGQTPLFQTGHRPFALTLDENKNELMVVDWGGEVMEVFDLTSAQKKSTTDLGYAIAPYPATNIELGEFLFYNTGWSNNGRKSCATCHLDELLLDGIPYANGATAANAYHKVPANFNLQTTNSYFWNGSFGNGSYASLAADAQSRTNCELILFGEVEGPASNPQTRIGDPANRVTNGQDAQCRPDTSGQTILPANFAQIATIIAAQRQIRDQLVKGITGLGFDAVARTVDFYSVSEMRLPPNPLTYLQQNNQLDGDTMAQIQKGQGVFTNAGCGNCHQPNNAQHPFTDGLNHGSGTQWVSQFIQTYNTDPRLLAQLPQGIPPQMIQGQSNSSKDKEINVHLDPVDFFAPFCFDLNKCLKFDDPLAARGNNVLETDRLNTLVNINLANVERGFMPGNVNGQPQSNTPSLRGIWFQTNFLRHGLAHTLTETILAPGHPALRPGEKGFAVDALGNFDVHGTTRNLSQADVDALYLYLTTIE